MKPSYILKVSDGTTIPFNGPLYEARALAENIVDEVGATVELFQCIAVCSPHEPFDWEFAGNVKTVPVGDEG